MTGAAESAIPLCRFRLVIYAPSSCTLCIRGRSKNHAEMHDMWFSRTGAIHIMFAVSPESNLDVGSSNCSWESSLAAWMAEVASRCPPLFGDRWQEALM